MKSKKETEFHITINSIGDSNLWEGYGKIKSKSAMYLAFNTCIIMAKTFVGKKKGEFLYELAMFILANLNINSYNEIGEDVKKYEKHKPEDLYVLKKNE